MQDHTQASDSTSISPAELQTFAGESDRKRLSGAALRAFLALTGHWRLSNAEAVVLLGVSGSTWDRIKRGRRPTLSQDQLTRISALVGIYKGLHLLFADGMADRWIGLPNSGPLFENRKPLRALIEGGIPRMLEVRRYVDAVRGGV